MYTEDDLNGAVAAGALSAADAARLRAHVEAARATPRTDEESFRLVTSFNDIFVSIGVVIMLVAVGAIGAAVTPDGVNAPFSAVAIALTAALTAATAWGLAEVFTRGRRMALPSIILTIAFIGSVFVAATALILAPFAALEANDTAKDLAGRLGGSALAAGALVAALAAVAVAITVFAARLHWRRFMVPITIAVGAAAAAGGIIAGAALTFEVLAGDTARFPVLPVVFATGVLLFAFAMRWDMSDRTRVTRRSDVAFWLHLLAAPMIAHPLFAMLGIVGGGAAEAGALAAIGVLALYGVFAFVALAIDRRALLVSALAYVLVAMGMLLRTFGAVDSGFAWTALLIGSALLTLSVFWTGLRRRVVALLPASWQEKVPPVAFGTADVPAERAAAA